MPMTPTENDVAVTRLNDAPRLRCGATCAGRRWLLVGAPSGSSSAVGGLDRRLAREGEQSGGGLECVDLRGGRSGCRCRDCGDDRGSVGERLERTRRRSARAPSTTGSSSSKGSAGTSTVSSSGAGAGRRRRQAATGARRRASGVDDRLLGRLTRCGGCDGVDERVPLRWRPRRAPSRRPRAAAMSAQRRRSERPAGGCDGQARRPQSERWTGAGDPRRSPGALGALPRRSGAGVSAREAPGVSAVA